jgi:hypothetical protein
VDLGHAAFESAYARKGMFVSAASVLSGRAQTQCTNPRARSKCSLVLCGDPLGAQHTDVKVYPTQISDAIDRFAS